MSRQYTKTHEWLTYTPEGKARIGLTDHAQKVMGSLVFAGLPEVGDTVTAGEPFGEVESVKAVSDVLSPVGGTVCAVNEEAAEEPSLINENPYGTWLIEVENIDGTAELMDEEAYAAFLASEG